MPIADADLPANDADSLQAAAELAALTPRALRVLWMINQAVQEDVVDFLSTAPEPLKERTEAQWRAVARRMLKKSNVPPALRKGPSLEFYVWNFQQAVWLCSDVLALELAHDAVVLHMGRVACAGEAKAVQRDAALRRAYLGA